MHYFGISRAPYTMHSRVGVYLTGTVTAKVLSMYLHEMHPLKCCVTGNEECVLQLFYYSKPKETYETNLRTLYGTKIVVVMCFLYNDGNTFQLLKHICVQCLYSCCCPGRTLNQVNKAILV